MKKNILFCSIVLSLISACGGSSGHSIDLSAAKRSKGNELEDFEFRLERGSSAKPEIGEIIKFKHRKPEKDEWKYEIGINYPKNMICWPIKSGFECTMTDTEEAKVTAFVRDPDKKVEPRTADFTFNRK